MGSKMIILLGPNFPLFLAQAVGQRAKKYVTYLILMSQLNLKPNFSTIGLKT